MNTKQNVIQFPTESVACPKLKQTRAEVAVSINRISRHRANADLRHASADDEHIAGIEPISLGKRMKMCRPVRLKSRFRDEYPPRHFRRNVA
ncbi:MAG TPA: hypothetical protein VFT82_02625 [Candidatus Paceibacterota bacterium]|nr:hypothetical protein [Candidatus Paceibacterota bacterium]